MPSKTTLAMAGVSDPLRVGLVSGLTLIERPDTEIGLHTSFRANEAGTRQLFSPLFRVTIVVKNLELIVLNTKAFGLTKRGH